MASPGPAFVTGASGFIGRHLVRALLRQDRPVLALCRRPENGRDLQGPGFHAIWGDLEKPHSYLPYLTRETTVFHLAAVRGLLVRDPERMRHVNEAAGLELGQVCARARVAKFVYVSSAVVFGPSKEQPATESRGYNLDSEANLYIRSRVQALLRLNQLVEQGLNLVTVCPTIVFGPDHPNHRNLVTSYLRLLLRFRIEFGVTGGWQKRNLVYVEDVVRGILSGENHPGSGEEFILGGEDISLCDLNRLILEQVGGSLKFSVSIPGSVAAMLAKIADLVWGYSSDSGYAAALRTLTQEWRFSSVKAETALGYSSTSLAHAIANTLKWIDTSESPFAKK